MSSWDDLSGEPVGRHVGPFPQRPFLEIYWRHFGIESPHIVVAEQAAAALVVVDGVTRFVGEAQLTDYHSTLGVVTPSLIDGMLAVAGAEARCDLDSLPDEVAQPLMAGFAEAGMKTELDRHESCLVLHLPGAAEAAAWEAVLGGRDRHELRRKRRRFREGLGEPELVRGPLHLSEFMRLHRAAPGEKGGFMTDAREAFFADLLGVPGARLDALMAGDSVVAAAFGFEDEHAYYLYNSAYDPGVASASPGIILVDALIAEAAVSGRTRFDFLKGDEGYKARLGATERPLYRLRVWS